MAKFTSGAGYVIRLLLIFALGCSSSSRTKYQAYEKKQGYRELPAEGRMRVVNFQANPYTNKEDAELFAKFRAIESCREEGFKLAHILDVRDKSLSKDVVRSSASGFPSYYYGMSPFYDRFYSGFGVGFSTMTSRTWEETYVYPSFNVYFDCLNEAFGPEIILREVSAGEMRLLVKDLKGALQVEEVLTQSPNAGVLEVGDVILKVKGKRVQGVPALLREFSGTGSRVPVELMREGVRRVVSLRGVNVSDFIYKSQEGIIQGGCRKKEMKKRSLCLEKEANSAMGKGD